MSILQPDPYWDYVKALFHFDGPDNSTRIVDERHGAVTVTGNAKISTLQSKIGGSSLVLDGTGDRVSVTTTAPGGQDFVAESFVYPRSTANTSPTAWGFGSALSAGTALLLVDASGYANKYSFWVGSFSTGEALLVSASDVVYDQWVHVAVTRNGTTWKLWINGVAEATVTNSATVTNTLLNIGGTPTATAYDFFGYIDEFRLTVGHYRYTTNFTPPTERFPDYRTTTTDPHFDKVKLLCHFDGENGSTTFVDQKGHTLVRTGSPTISTAVSKLGGSSLLTGTLNGDHISCTHSDFNFGMGDFTVEFWAYSPPTSYVFPTVIVTAADNATEAIGVWVGGNEYSSNFRINSAIAITISGAQPENVWEHFAYVRDGGNFRLYKNGTHRGAVSASGVTLGNTIRIGGAGRYIDDVRVTLGLCRYPNAAPFTPPTEPSPDQGIQKLTGTVLDQAGNPVARTVRSYRSSDGLFVDTAVSSAVDGGFALRATDTTEHFVVVQDATKNALVYDHIVPVI